MLRTITCSEIKFSVLSTPKLMTNGYGNGRIFQVPLLLPAKPSAGGEVPMSLARYTCAALAGFCLAAGPSIAAGCPSLGHCRFTEAEGGKLLHERNTKDKLVWTVPKICGRSDSPSRPDLICKEIANCAKAGAFGKYLKAVTFNCEGKQFDSYFGLDGMTFGILDFTPDNLPNVIREYRARNPEKFDEVFGPLQMPIKGSCVTPDWVCQSNKQAKFMCDPQISSAFRRAVLVPDFQKAQIDLALRKYERSRKTYEPLGLKSEYGNTAMAVLANNLPNTPECRPAAWKKTCSHNQDDEKALVDCMLGEYAKHRCRGTRSKSGVDDRVAAIKETFANSPSSTNIHPSADDIISCSDRWGQPSPLPTSKPRRPKSTKAS